MAKQRKPVRRKSPEPTPFCPFAATRKCPRRRMPDGCELWKQGPAPDPGNCTFQDIAGWLSHLVRLDGQRLEAVRGATGAGGGAPFNPEDLVRPTPQQAQQQDVGQEPTLRMVKIQERPPTAGTEGTRSDG